MSRPLKQLTHVPVRKILLKTIGVVGFVSMAVLAPNSLQTLAKLGIIKNRYYKNYLPKALQKLQDQGLIKMVKNHQGLRCVALTAKGCQKLKQYQLGEILITKTKKWDGFYRVIIFDIKEWKRAKRDELRRQLVGWGFVKLQNSVWVYPYECREAVLLLKSYFQLGREVIYLTVKEIENDRWLKKEFNLA
ncbi:MAG: hypothetical protein HYT48_00930 [Candidatus Vogelbacteria bacterium]|nr:hypothetical protein [Candidatus Vogelbacteria bacterium]